MRLKRLAACLAALTLIAAWSGAAWAYATVGAIANFDGGNGNNPAGVTLFSNGYLYGVAGEGPAPSNNGEIYRIKPASGTIEILYNFTSSSGYFPIGKVVLSAAGAVFGVTGAGGAGGAGTVFAFNPANGRLRVVHAFVPGEGSPVGGVVFGRDGMLYGVTQSPPSYGPGMIFRLNPATGQLTKLHDLTGQNGLSVTDPLLPGPDGSLYGSAPYTYASNYGAVFRLIPTTGAFSLIHAFLPGEGMQSTKLAIDPKGALYIGRMLTSSTGKIVRFAPSTFAMTDFTTFGPANGSYPVGAMTFNGNGNMIGVSATGGFSGGTLFRAMAGTGGRQTLYQYNTGFPAYEGTPVSDIISTRLGIFGTTSGGGAYQQGTVFSVTFGN